MKKNVFTLTGAAAIAMTMLFSACKKDDKAPTEEVYSATGRLDASRSLATAAVTNSKLTVKYNSPNSFGDAQGVIDGTINFSGYTTTPSSTPDSVVLFATKPGGGQVSYLTVTSSTAVSNYYTFVNSNSAGSFTFRNFPLVNDITSYLKDGLGYMRIGKNNKYIYVLFDAVTRL